LAEKQAAQAAAESAEAEAAAAAAEAAALTDGSVEAIAPVKE